MLAKEKKIAFPIQFAKGKKDGQVKGKLPFFFACMSN